MKRILWYVCVIWIGFLAGCGAVHQVDAITTDAGAEARPALDASPSDSLAENQSDGGAAEVAAEVAPEVAPDVAPACLSRDLSGFALNARCPDAGACYGACALDGAQFVGCVAGFDAGVTCAARCTACP